MCLVNLAARENVWNKTTCLIDILLHTLIARAWPDPFIAQFNLKLGSIDFWGPEQTQFDIFVFQAPRSDLVLVLCE